jgi:hypothetical protein
VPRQFGRHGQSDRSGTHDKDIGQTGVSFEGGDAFSRRAKPRRPAEFKIRHRTDSAGSRLPN